MRWALIAMVSINIWFVQRLIQHSDDIAAEVKEISTKLARVDLPEMDARISRLETEHQLLKGQLNALKVLPTSTLKNEDSRSNVSGRAHTSSHTPVFQTSAPLGHPFGSPSSSSSRFGIRWDCCTSTGSRHRKGHSCSWHYSSSH